MDERTSFSLLSVLFLRAKNLRLETLESSSFFQAHGWTEKEFLRRLDEEADVVALCISAPI